MNLYEYIQSLKKNGKCSFSISDVLSALNTKSRKAILSSIEHLVLKEELVSPAKGFYIILPPEYQILGCLPAEFFIPYLMDYWKCNYYACLLTAANYHGASHQAVMVFQVMSEKRRPPIICGKIQINFILNKNLQDSPTQKISTRMSMLTISTPEGTAMDLLKYPRQSGGLSHIATILTELHETMTAGKLLELAKKSTTLAWQQRLGYILELVGANELANAIHENLSEQKRVDYILLAPGKKINKNSRKNEKWKIIENITIESDL